MPIPVSLTSQVNRSSSTRALIAITLFTGAYIAEIVRGGLQAVDRGQTEAALAVGLPTTKVMRFIVLPQALRAVIPAMVGQFISLFKDTSLLTIIGVLYQFVPALTKRREVDRDDVQAEVELLPEPPLSHLPR